MHMPRQNGKYICRGKTGNAYAEARREIHMPRQDGKFICRDEKTRKRESHFWNFNGSWKTIIFLCFPGLLIHVFGRALRVIRPLGYAKSMPRDSRRESRATVCQSYKTATKLTSLYDEKLGRTWNHMPRVCQDEKYEKFTYLSFPAITCNSGQDEKYEKRTFLQGEMRITCREDVCRVYAEARREIHMPRQDDKFECRGKTENSICRRIRNV